jgi:DNA replication protein DnaC
VPLTKQWLKPLLGFSVSRTAILDRFLSRTEVIQITGKSYRLKDRACSKEKTRDNVDSQAESTSRF